MQKSNSVVSHSRIERIAGSGNKEPMNWPLLLLVFMVPLQNIYLFKLPSFSGGINFINITLLLVLMVWFFSKHFNSSTSTSLKWPVITFIGIYIFSAIYTKDALGFYPERHFNSIKDIVTSMIVFFAVLNCVRSRKAIIYMLVATFLPLLYMFKVFYVQSQSVASWHYDDDLRLAVGTFTELGSNEMGAFYAAYALVLLAIALFSKSKIIKLVLFGLVALNIYSVMYSYSRGAYLSLLFGICVLLWNYKKSLLLVLIIAVPIFLSIFQSLLPISVSERFETIFVEKHEKRDESAESRFELWQEAFNYYKDSPVFGIGHSVFQATNKYKKDTHNYFIKVLVEQGVIGLICIILIFWRACKLGNELYKNADDHLYKGLGLGLLSCALALIFANMFGDRFSHYAMITYFWVYLALTQRALLLLEDKVDESPVQA